MTAMGAVALAGCSAEEEPERHDVEDGVVCEFLSLDSVEEAIGTDIAGLEVTGFLYSGRASCLIAPVDGTKLLHVVAEDAPPGSDAILSFAEVIGNSYGEPNYLSDEVGWTVTWKKDTATAVANSGAWLLHGGWKVSAEIADSDDVDTGPELEQQAMMLVREAIDALDLPEQWPYDQPPPDPIPQMWDEEVWRGGSTG